MEIYFKVAITITVPSAIVTIISMGIVTATNINAFMFGVGGGITGMMIGVNILAVGLLIDMWRES